MTSAPLEPWEFPAQRHLGKTLPIGLKWSHRYLTTGKRKLALHLVDPNTEEMLASSASGGLSSQAYCLENSLVGYRLTEQSGEWPHRPKASLSWPQAT